MTRRVNVLAMMGAIAAMGAPSTSEHVLSAPATIDPPDIMFETRDDRRRRMAKEHARYAESARRSTPEPNRHNRANRHVLIERAEAKRKRKAAKRLTANDK